MSHGESSGALPPALRCLPPQWGLTRLRYLSSIRYGLGQPPREMADGLPLIRATNVKRGRIVRDNLVFVDPSDVPVGRDAILREGDIVVVRSGAYTGDSALVTAEFDGAVTGYDMVVRPTQADSRFLAYTLLSSPVLNDQIDLCRLRAAQPHLNAKELGDIHIAVPPLEEQRAIADYLDEKTAAIDALIAKRERHVELLEERHLATVSTLVTSGLDASAPVRQTGIPWLGEVPVHWVVADLKRVLSSADYGISDSLGGEGEVPVLRMGNIRRGEVVMDDLKFVGDVGDAMLLRPLDLLFNRTNSLDLVGRVGIFRGSECARVTFASYLVRFRTTPGMDPQYLCYLLNTPAVLEMARAMALPAIGQANLSPSRYGYLRICIPPLEEQRAIVEVIARRRAAVRASQAVIRRQIEKLREYRQTLISAAVTGQLPVREEVPA